MKVAEMRGRAWMKKALTELALWPVEGQTSQRPVAGCFQSGTCCSRRWRGG